MMTTHFIGIASGGIFQTLHEQRSAITNLGVGVFTMQGFEHRNKEKRESTRHCNGKGNLQKQTLYRLFDGFYF